MQLPFHGHLLKSVLTQGFVQYHGHRVGQIQGADVAPHGNPHTVFLVLQKKLLRNPRALLAEHNIAARFIGSLRVHLVGFGGGHIDLCPRIPLQKILEVAVHDHIQHIPVIKTCPLSGLLVDLKAQGLYKVEPGVGRHTGSSDIARVGRYLRFKQYNIHSQTFPSSRFTNRSIRPNASFRLFKE